jgi:hypothetical protein
MNSSPIWPRRDYNCGRDFFPICHHLGNRGHRSDMAESSNDAVSNVVRRGDESEEYAEDLLPGETLYGEARTSFDDIRVEPFLSRLRSRFTFRRKPNWIPLYELGTKESDPQSQLGRSKPYWSMCINCSFFAFAFM